MATLTVSVPKGNYWSVGTNILWTNSEGQIVIPIEEIYEMTNEEIGETVRDLVEIAYLCSAIDIARRVLDPYALTRTREQKQELIARLSEFAQRHDDIDAAIALLKLPKPAKRPPRPPMVKKREMPGYVYLMRAETGQYKIGRARNPHKRNAVLGTHMPFQVELLHIIPVSNMHKAETALHARFESKRHIGEWFNLDDSDVAWVMSLQSGDDI
jgi:predicted GIY-YIG superfamily endonuclease